MSKALKRVLAQDDAIIFVGSGISRWSGLPSWEGLVADLADYLENNDIDASLVRQESNAGDLLQAASYGFLKLTPQQITVFMRDVCRSGSALPSAIHQAIMALPPSCFITTNYDDLLEQAYRKYRQEPSEPRVVLNTQLLEQAEIIHAQARNFIFKPHGDARHGESIVLTREQYRMLLPEGPLSATLNTFKTLLQSRPVLFLGFGLRDPDFLHLRDLLANIYRGGMRDHYAIVSDPVRDQEDYWRTHYGIHLVGYKTADGGRDHSGLLALLVQLLPTQATPVPRETLEIEDPAAILALARYAASCLKPSGSGRFVIRVSVGSAANGHNQRPIPYDHWPVERLMEEGPSQFILLGEPGAGKSFAIREAVNSIASSLQDACLRGELDTSVRIPIAIDLKLYDGNLEALIDDKFSESLSLDQLYNSFPVTLYLDSYNEMPRSFREDGTFDRQLDVLLKDKPMIGLVIGSRTSDGLNQLDFPICMLSEISAEEIERRLSASNVDLPTIHQRDIINILQRPFYFRLLDRAVMSLDQVHVPGDLYAQFIGNIEADFAASFANNIDLISAMQQQAYAALEQGQEAFLVSDLETAISVVAPQFTPGEIEQVTNWLASKEVIIPMQGGRAAFVHQSVTEFLAACELGIRLGGETSEVDGLINLRRWDNALFLALGMLDEPLAAAVLGEITARDVSFALNAARFLQYGSEALVGQLLQVVANLPSAAFDYDAKFAFGRLPFAPSHEPALRRILSLPPLRGEAFNGLAKAIGSSVKQELVDSLFAEPASGPIQEIGEALGQLLEPGDLGKLVERLACSDPTSLDDDHGITNQQVDAVASAVKYFDPDSIKRETIDRLGTFDVEGQRIIAALVCDIFTDSKSADGLIMIIEVTRRRLPGTIFALYLNVYFDSDRRRAFLDELDDSLFETILHYMDNGDRWSIELLESCADENAVSSRVLAEADRSTGIRRNVLEYCATRDTNALFSAIELRSTQGGADTELVLLQLIDFADLDWGGRHELLINVLSRQNLTLARLVLGGSSPPILSGLDSIDLGDVEPWVNWLIELINNDDEPDNHGAQWTAMQLAFLIARSSASDTKEQILNLVDNGTPHQKWVAAVMLLPRMDGLSIADLSGITIDLLKSLVVIGEGGSEFRPHVFAQIADEAFLRNELFPLAKKSEVARNAIEQITRQVGKRLGIRVALPKSIDGRHIV